MRTSRIETYLTTLSAEKKKALITFIMGGDPNIDASLETLHAMVDNGADILEIGMPFTDPMADGPVIQAAGLRALQSGTNLKNILSLVSDFRQKNTKTPIVLMGYLNPILTYGSDKFIRDALNSGVDGLIIVDLPPEEADDIQSKTAESGLNLIRLITPTTDMTRLPKVLNGASGFLYYVSIAGVTGTKSADISTVRDHIATIKTKTDLPVMAGFGIKTPENAAEMSAIADGIVVGSALVENMIDYHHTTSHAIGAQVAALKSALAA